MGVVIPNRCRVGEGGDARRQRRDDVQGKGGAAARAFDPKRANDQGANRASAGPVRAGPTRRACAQIEGRIGRHRLRKHHARQRSVAGVAVDKGIGQDAARCRRNAAVALGDPQIVLGNPHWRVITQHRQHHAAEHARGRDAVQGVAAERRLQRRVGDDDGRLLPDRQGAQIRPAQLSGRHHAGDRRRADVTQIARVKRVGQRHRGQGEAARIGQFDREADQLADDNGTAISPLAEFKIDPRRLRCADFVRCVRLRCRGRDPRRVGDHNIEGCLGQGRDREQDLGPGARRQGRGKPAQQGQVDIRSSDARRLADNPVVGHPRRQGIGDIDVFSRQSALVADRQNPGDRLAGDDRAARLGILQDIDVGIQDRRRGGKRVVGRRQIRRAAGDCGRVCDALGRARIHRDREDDSLRRPGGEGRCVETQRLSACRDNRPGDHAAEGDAGGQHVGDRDVARVGRAIVGVNECVSKGVARAQVPNDTHRIGRVELGDRQVGGEDQRHGHRCRAGETVVGVGDAGRVDDARVDRRAGHGVDDQGEGTRRARRETRAQLPGDAAARQRA